ncbi:hypothetical protein MLD38_016270 [Melastoma candidum]|uniref:Uncharacterized protein n=1 Tax=Melastoma candidum TaxID=119954 RepID=A0ACB9RMK0_9MYRT|nr:hypothetical protein MLD38_016270 [Melastoma candidum]
MFTRRTSPPPFAPPTVTLPRSRVEWSSLLQEILPLHYQGRQLLQAGSLLLVEDLHPLCDPRDCARLVMSGPGGYHPPPAWHSPLQRLRRLASG